MEERDKDSEIIHTLIDKMGNVVDGVNMGHVIPALIYMLASSQSDDVMTEEHFVKNVTEDLFNWFRVFKANGEKGEIEWLQ
jgi:hypothetical protein